MHDFFFFFIQLSFCFIRDIDRKFFFIKKKCSTFYCYFQDKMKDLRKKTARIQKKKGKRIKNFENWQTQKKKILKTPKPRL